MSRSTRQRYGTLGNSQESSQRGHASQMSHTNSASHSSQRTNASQSSQRTNASQSSQRTNASQSSQRSNASHESQSSSQVEGSSQVTALSMDDFDNLVSDVVQYILVQDHHKYPIKQLDIKKNAMKLHAKYYKNVMDRAKEVLLQNFGLRLVEVEPDSSKSYILVSNFAQTFTPREEQQPRYVLLLLVLSLIFMCGNCVTEDVMWKFLAGLKILKEDVRHDYFGDVKKLMTQELVRQLYLKYTRIADTDPVKYEFRWGRRAEEEVEKKVLLQFVGKVFGQQDLSVWTAQYDEIKEQENQAAPSRRRAK